MTKEKKFNLKLKNTIKTYFFNFNNLRGCFLSEVPNFLTFFQYTTFMTFMKKKNLFNILRNLIFLPLSLKERFNM